jgi:hypothetical protein
MIWEDKRLTDVVEADLLQVLESETEEHKHLDYKAELYPSNDAGQKDFLVDVCAFANAEGGVLLLGVPEMRDAATNRPPGVPDLENFKGLELANAESLLVAYDAKVVSCIEEKISLETRAIRLSNGRYVLAVRVPNSLNKPHCVRKDQKRYFPMRRDRHTYYMDVQEIKELVMGTVSRREQAEQALLKVLAENRENKTDMPYLVFGSLPIFSKDYLVDLRDQNIVKAMQTFDLLSNQRYGNCEFSFDGLERRSDNYEAVAQLRRTGLVRYSQLIAAQKLDNGAAAFFPTGIDILFRKFIQESSRVYNTAGVGGPFLVTMMIKAQCNMTGRYPDSMYFQGHVERGILIRGQHLFPVMEAYDFGDLDTIIRPLCDQVHQGFGEAASPNFDADGKWIEARR